MKKIDKKLPKEIEQQFNNEEENPLEVWMPVIYKGNATTSEVSNFGRVRSTVTLKIRRQHIGSTGYLCFQLPFYGNRFRLKTHRYIGFNFIPNPHNKPFINHMDGNKLNNSLENLEWVTNHENILHAVSLGLVKKGERHLNFGRINELAPRSRPVNQFDLNGNFIRAWPSTQQIKREIGINRTSIYCVLNNKAKSTHGFIFKYKQNEKDK